MRQRLLIKVFAILSSHFFTPCIFSIKIKTCWAILGLKMCANDRFLYNRHDCMNIVCLLSTAVEIFFAYYSYRMTSPKITEPLGKNMIHNTFNKSCRDPVNFKHYVGFQLQCAYDITSKVQSLLKFVISVFVQRFVASPSLYQIF